MRGAGRKLVKKEDELKEEYARACSTFSIQSRSEAYAVLRTYRGVSVSTAMDGKLCANSKNWLVVGKVVRMRKEMMRMKTKLKLMRDRLVG